MRVYPRERGGTTLTIAPPDTVTVLSPRARGNVDYRYNSVKASGSIPASAGERGTSTASSSSSGVYPRERGGTEYREALGNSKKGLSPRARGNAEVGRPDAGDPGSIPASAGERTDAQMKGLAVYLGERER